METSDEREVFTRILLLILASTDDGSWEGERRAIHWWVAFLRGLEDEEERAGD
jgi:hypothetical protein